MASVCGEVKSSDFIDCTTTVFTDMEKSIVVE